jgi:hypothetical protein
MSGRIQLDAWESSTALLEMANHQIPKTK